VPDTREPARQPAQEPAGAASRVLRAPQALLRHPPYRRATTIVCVALAMAALFVTSYVDALGRPAARAVDVAVVTGSGADAAGGPVDQLQAALRHGLVVHPAADAAAAREAVAEQRAYAVVDLDDGTPRLQLSSASGSSVARVLTTAALGVSDSTGQRWAVSDLHPLPSSDPSGLAVFYLVLGSTILGFVTTFQLRANAKPLPLRDWLAFTGGLSVLGGLVLAATAQGLGVPVVLWEAWGLLTLQMATASAFAGTAALVVGRWAVLPTWLLFVVLGNTSSGGAVAPGLLPEPFSTLSRVLPTGSTVSALRSAAYFPDTQHLEPVLVLLAWAVGTSAVLVAVSRLRGRSPGEE